MTNENEIRSQIMNNLVYYRKKAGLTQLEAANKLSYSDKAISKWERGLGIPDIIVLSQLADIYGITLSELIETTTDDLKAKEPLAEVKDDAYILRKRRRLISFLSVGLVWLVAAILYSIFVIIFQRVGKFYLIFIYAIPASFIVALVFNLMWGRNIFNAVYESFLAWTLAFALIITFFPIINNSNIWFLLLIPFAFQILVVLWNNLLSTGEISIKIKKDKKE